MARIWCAEWWVEDECLFLRGGREGGQGEERDRHIHSGNQHLSLGTMLLLKKGEKQNSYFCGMYLPEVGG